MKEYNLENEYLSLTVIDFGARIHKLTYKDSVGTQEVVHSLEHQQDHLNDDTSLNAVVGRFAGRICSNSITLDETEYPIQTINGVHLHGGVGFSKRVWKIQSMTSGTTPSITLSYLSKHLEDGYPGNLNVSVTYTLVEKSLEVKLEAQSDTTTLVNLTHHAYFKLDNSNKFDHLEFTIPATYFIETNENLCPTGNLISVEGHPFDFNKPKRLESTQLDTSFVIDQSKSIEVYSPKTKMRIKATTNQPTAVIYTPESCVGFCIEAQNFTDSPNQEGFVSAILKKGEVYSNLTRYEFSRE